MAARPSLNLPLQLTQFIGREREIASIQGLLAPDPSAGQFMQLSPGANWARARLVTMTGVGGCGKTRLAIEAAASLSRDSSIFNPFSAGAWFVDLAPLTNPARLPQVIASALNLRENPHRSAIETLVQALKSKKLLLLLDNCEHLLPACAQLTSTLLQACPEITVLATSRAPLNIPGEMIFPVPALEIINLDDRLPLTNLVNCEAVRLFVDRATAVQPDFRMSEAQARAVIEICRQLDGLPLAIELAAARVRMLTPQQIVRRLNDSLQLLRSTNPLAVDRHQNLHAAYDWSYTLLSAPERVLFRRLAVFAGGWTLSAAEQVAGFAPLKPTDVFELHERLLDQSLISRMDDGQGARGRYRMLEPLRQFAAEKLAESAESGELRERQLEHFALFAAQAWYGFLTPQYLSWLDRAEAEIGNFRLALEWAMEGGNVEVGLELAVSLFHFWLDRNFLLESIEFLQRLLEYSKEVTPNRTRGKALAFLSLSHLRLGDYRSAIKTAEQSLAIEQILPDLRIRAYALSGLGHAYAFQDQFPQSISSLLQSLDLFREIHDVTGQAWTLSRLGGVALMMGDYAVAEKWLDELENLLRQAGNKMYLSYALRYKAYALFYQGDYRGAVILFQELVNSWEVQDVYPGTLAACSMTALKLGHYEEAAVILGAAEAMIAANHVTLLPYDDDQFKHYTAVVKELFNDDLIAQAWANGQELTLEQAVEKAQVLCESLLTSITSADFPAGLTKREVEVLQLLALGLTNQQIADNLIISRRTVHAHLRAAYGKLDVRTRTAAAQEANRLKLF